ncbi:hypothetical protein J2129_000249 [Methanofollis sp. W23]|uniref:hypothetical protein n=1 Tax=Methanofollis sp. W23 TaxID=2817849 RepID=UPI001AE270ED|nr:hypothetical protein [Methanofollis sp. W23]MBP2144795.1 hypothetical protein [Methanofollis sp. W23]
MGIVFHGRPHLSSSVGGLGGETPRREMTGNLDDGGADPSEEFSILCVLASTGYGEFKLSCKPKERIVRIIFMVKHPLFITTTPL